MCAAGTYSLGNTAASCTPCPPGRFGSTAGVGTASCTGACAAGFFCLAGSTNGTAVPCAPGFYSTGAAGACTPCPATTPYSLLGANSTAACVSCASGCEAGTYGAYVCPGAFPDWTVWFDTAGVEGTHSCLRFVAGALSWSNSNARCAAMGTGVHLVTSRQVGHRGWGGVYPREARTCCVDTPSWEAVLCRRGTWSLDACVRASLLACVCVGGGGWAGVDGWHPASW
jgi:hypothetical protein